MDPAVREWSFNIQLNPNSAATATKDIAPVGKHFASNPAAAQKVFAPKTPTATKTPKKGNYCGKNRKLFSVRWNWPKMTARIIRNVIVLRKKRGVPLVKLLILAVNNYEFYTELPNGILQLAQGNIDVPQGEAKAAQFYSVSMRFWVAPDPLWRFKNAVFTWRHNIRARVGLTSRAWQPKLGLLPRKIDSPTAYRLQFQLTLLLETESIMFKTTQTACAAIVFATFLALGANSYGGDIVKMDQVPMMRNDIFAVPMPPGWLFGGESTNETYVVSPDLSAGFGFVGLERIRPMSPRQFLGYIADVYKIRDFKVLGGKKIACDSGEMVEFEYTSTSADGRPVKSWARVVTVDVFGAGAGYIWSASAYADRYDAMIGDLQAMALRIQILDDGAAFNRAVDLYHPQNRNLNHPLDSTYTDAYWGRQVSQEAAAKRDSEVRRGSFMMLDPETGDKYWVGPTAFRPDGTVPNPARPTENLVPPKYWVHHSING